MVQVIPKTTSKQTGTFRRLVPWFSFLLVIIVFVLYFIFNQQVGRAEIALVKAEEDLAEAKTEQEEELERRIKTFKTRVDDVVILLQEREKASDFFEFLETFVHPAVYFSTISFDMEAKKARLEGTADDFVSLGQQIFAFENDPFIEAIKLPSVASAEEGKIKFNLELFLAKDGPGEEIK